jgi:hypothetical protein
MITDFNGVAADFAVLNVLLRPGRQVEQHGYPLTAMGAGENMLHGVNPWLFKLITKLPIIYNKRIIKISFLAK